jgi:Secretion system C-terminal sorting domain
VFGNLAMVTGVGLLQTGESSANFINCNEYDATLNSPYDPTIIDGIFVGGNNLGSNFTSNKFDCKYDVDVRELEDATAPSGFFQGSLPNQGGELNPVFNEFTDYNLNQHKVEILTPDPAYNLTQLFKYFPPTTDCQSRLLPRCPILGTCSNVCALYNFSNFGNLNSNFPVCSFGAINGILQPGDCATRECLDQYYVKLGQLDNLIVSGSTQYKGERQQVNNKKMSLLHHLTDSLYRVGNISVAIQFWSSDPDRVSRESLLGLYLQTQNFTAAAQMLNTYPTATTEDVQFKLIQQVNLNSKTQGSNFSVSTQESTALYSIANSYSAQSGYAQMLLECLFGAKFEPRIPSAPVNPRSIEGQLRPEKAVFFNVFPNPVGNVLNIELADRAQLESTLTVSDMFGKVKFSTKFTGATQIDLTQFAPAIYFATLTLPNGRQQTIRFVKTDM